MPGDLLQGAQLFLRVGAGAGALSEACHAADAQAAARQEGEAEVAGPCLEPARQLLLDLVAGRAPLPRFV